MAGVSENWGTLSDPQGSGTCVRLVPMPTCLILLWLSQRTISSAPELSSGLYHWDPYPRRAGAIPETLFPLLATLGEYSRKDRATGRDSGLRVGISPAVLSPVLHRILGLISSRTAICVTPTCHLLVGVGRRVGHGRGCITSVGWIM